MVYITASKCGHTIDHTSSPIGHTNIASPTVSLCSSCRDFEKLRRHRKEYQNRLDSARKAATDLSGEFKMTSEVRTARTNLSTVTAALYNDPNFREQHDDLALAPRKSKGKVAMETKWFTTAPTTGASMFKWPRATTQPTSTATSQPTDTITSQPTDTDIETTDVPAREKKHARFVEDEYRPEAGYRSPRYFKRVGEHPGKQPKRYSPGRYAPSGDGFYNTSDPEAEVNAMFAQMRIEAAEKATKEAAEKAAKDENLGKESDVKS